MHKAIIGIYMIRNKHNSKVYIGASKNIKKRWNVHTKQWRDGHNSKSLQADYDVGGMVIFEFKIVETLEHAEQLKEREQFYIELFDSKNPERGYNLNDASNSRAVPDILTHDGVSKSIKEWAKERGWTPHAIRSRLSLGWSVQKALETPLGVEKKGTPSKLIEWEGKVWTMKNLCNHYGVKKTTFHKRIHSLGYTVEEALFMKGHANSERSKIET